MAAAEARAAWQRAANRYFVQEDAKRAPKLACCQSSTSSSKQTSSGPTSISDGPDHPPVGFMPSSRTPSWSNLPPDAKWWLQTQPNYGLQRGLNVEHLNTKQADVETGPPVTAKTDSQGEGVGTMSDESIQSIVYEDLESFLDVKKHPETKFEEMGFLEGKLDQDYLDLKNMTDYYEFLEMEMVGGSVSKPTCEFSNSDSSWLKEEKVPWWRVTDGEALASFVAHKSLHHIENCDLPPPQKMKVRREPYKHVDHDEILMSSIDWEARSEAVSIPSSGGSQRKHWSPAKGRLSKKENAATEPFSSPKLQISRTNDSTPEKGRISDSDPCKAQLLEALCHSQTRAREAEKAAKQACTEKEDILKLFFRQASQLFAYKQWFKLLQLESLLLENKDGESSPLMVFPDLLPWMPQKPRKLRKSWQKSVKAKRRKRGSPGNDIGKYAAAFALGFTLVGAGLILGWTVGWLLPTF